MPRIKEIAPMTVEPKTKPVGKGLGLPKDERQKIEDDSFEAQLRKRDQFVPAISGSFKSKRVSATEASLKSKAPTALNQLPDDVLIQIWRINMMWQVVLSDSVLHVCLACSDFEPTLEVAETFALQQYAKNKGLS